MTDRAGPRASDPAQLAPPPAEAGVPGLEERAPAVNGDPHRAGKYMLGIVVICVVLTGVWFAASKLTGSIKGSGGLRALVRGDRVEAEKKSTIDYRVHTAEDDAPLDITPPRPARAPAQSVPATFRPPSIDPAALAREAALRAQREHELALANIQAMRDVKIAEANAAAAKTTSLENAKANRAASAAERDAKARALALKEKMARRMVPVMSTDRVEPAGGVTTARNGEMPPGVSLPDPGSADAQTDDLVRFNERARRKIATVAPHPRDADPCLLGRAGQPLQIRYETAVSTEVPPAVVVAHTREPFRAGPGCPVLLPRDTPFLGALNARVQRGQSRLQVVFHTAQLPGRAPWDLPMSSPATGLLGQGGQPAHTDKLNEWMARFGNALLINMVGVFVADVAGGTDDRTRNAAADAFSESARDTLREDTRIRRKLYVDHGDLGTIVLAQDVDFTPMFEDEGEGEGAR